MRRWHYVYLALAKDGSYYCGYALDPRLRLVAHNAGRGAKALRGRQPAVLAYTRRFSNKGDALRHEAALKRFTHARKAQLSQRWLSAPANSSAHASAVKTSGRNASPRAVVRDRRRNRSRAG